MATSLVGASGNHMREGIFKALVLQLKQCGTEKKEYQLIFSILSKAGPENYVYVSTFHSSKLTTRN